MSRPSQRFVILGNPGSQRVVLFQAALKRQGFSPAEVVRYVDFLTDPANLTSRLSSRATLRIESPEKNFTVEKLLLEEGADDAQQEGSPFLPAADCRRLVFDRGRILYPRQAYLSFRSVLQKIAQCLKETNSQVMNRPADVEAMFDKRESHRRFCRAGLETPPSLPVVHCYDELLDRLEQAGWRRAFIKLAHGSSASGVAAFGRLPAFHEAITTVEMVRQNGEVRYYNSRKIQRYTHRDDLRDLFDFLCSQQVHVEKWLPKASLNGRDLDLRVLVINGAARHAVARQGTSPMTNLHLGNQRGDLAQVQYKLGAAGWRRVEEACRQAISLFPGSFYAGVDVLLTPGWRRAFLLEINAFGDLLPGVLWRGKDAYETEISAWINPQFWRRPTV